MLLNLAVYGCDKFRGSWLPSGVVLLGGTGAALIGAGLLLVSNHGGVIELGNAALVALAWCF